MLKALIRRFQCLITLMIRPDRTCSVQWRSINDNLLLVMDLIIHSRERRSPLCLLRLDQEKAFDRASYVCLERVLQKMNIPGPLLRWPKICLTDITSRVVVNRFDLPGWWRRENQLEGSPPLRPKLNPELECLTPDHAGKIIILKVIVLPILLYGGRVFPPGQRHREANYSVHFLLCLEKQKWVTLLKEERNGGVGGPRYS